MTAVVATAGCGYRTLVRRQAATQLRCPESELGVRELSGGHHFLVQGCGERELYHCGSDGCLSYAASVRQEAALHLNCPLAQITVEERDFRGLYLARGCGVEASYFCGLVGCFRPGSREQPGAHAVSRP
jgi:hypothetical protein